ncbi:hypothetical protein T492DRAFT_848927 [Pavlovales sp. CCMP2436]|nr:hypothetical protein T492DRAFT_848927 [Pavlovales sp. CCMP2436]|mmetsp:Transcript_892/g.2331  ORF Transcript_892/g.2331 Transcript_892/m.2331 type:complete len:169 (+) Transcript_892:21-527(+)
MRANLASERDERFSGTETPRRASSATEALVVASQLAGRANWLESQLEERAREFGIGRAVMAGELAALEGYARAQAMGWAFAEIEVRSLELQRKVLGTENRLLGRRIESILQTAEVEREAQVSAFCAEIARLEAELRTGAVRPNRGGDIAFSEASRIRSFAATSEDQEE